MRSMSKPDNIVSNECPECGSRLSKMYHGDAVTVTCPNFFGNCPKSMEVWFETTQSKEQST